MKTNKKAVLGFAVAMVVSLSVMQGNAMKTNKQDVNLVGAAVCYYSAEQGGSTVNQIAGIAAGGLIMNIGYGVGTATGATGVGMIAGAAIFL
jgi:hypothetical protein